MRQRAAAVVLTFAATIAASALATPRVLLYTADDTPQLRAAQAGVREVLGAITVEEVAASDAVVRLKGAAAEGSDVAVVAIGPHAATRAARDAPTLAAVDCMSAQAGASALAVPPQIPSEQQVAWLRRMLPAARYIGVLYDPAQNAQAIEPLAAAIRRAGLNPVLVPVATPAMLPAALVRVSASADALLAVADTTVYTRETAKTLLLFSFRHKLPLIGLSENWVQAGALFALDWDYREVGMFCGRLALQRLAGGNAAAPVPPRLHIFVNQRTARLLGLHWDDALRQSFDRIVE